MKTIVRYRQSCLIGYDCFAKALIQQLEGSLLENQAPLLLSKDAFIHLTAKVFNYLGSQALITLAGF